MLNLLLILGFAGMIVISAGFAGVTFMQGVQSSLDAEITTQRLLDVATQVQSHARYLEPQGTGTLTNYITALPTGATGTAPYAYNQVPSFITSSARSASGVPFEYCPYATANQAGTASTITMGDGSTTYNIKYYSGTDTNSQNYDTDTNGTTTPTNSSTNTLGFLVAAAPNKFYPPNCSAITTDSTGAYTIASGGIVAVIANDFINKMRVPASMTDFKLYVSTAPSGDGSGRDTSNYITLADALTIIQTLQPASAMIYIDGGTALSPNVYTVISTAPTALSQGTRLYLEGLTTNGGSPTVTTLNDLTIDEYSMLSIGNMTFQVGGASSHNLTINGTLEMADSSPILEANNVYVYGGAIKGFTNINSTCIAASNCYISSIKIIVNNNIVIDGGGVITSSGPMTFSGMGNRGFQLINGHVYGGTTMQFTPSGNGIVPIIIKAGGDLIAGTDTMTINTILNGSINGGMVIDPGGRFMGAANSAYRLNTAGNLYGSSVLVNEATSYGFYVHGEMDLMPQSAANATTTGVAVDYGSLPPTDGIILASGGRFMFEGTTGVSLGTAANRPTVGILDAGGSGFFTMGSTTTPYNIIYGSTSCWTYNAAAPTNIANLFTDSQGGGTASTTGYSTATQTTTFPNGWYRLYNNSANLICN